MSHTPGPWSAEYSETAEGWRVDGPAYFYSEVDGSALLDEPDARLIAAAPEMYEALERLDVAITRTIPATSPWDTPPDITAPEFWDVVYAARVVLRKARGES